MPKSVVTIRLDGALLAALRQRAADENRTLTNLIETVLKRAVGGSPGLGSGVPVSVAPPPLDLPEPIVIAAQDEAGEGLPALAGEA